MSRLGEFEEVCKNLRIAKRKNISLLHKFVFESEGDRTNRERLREFKGFEYDETSQEYKEKINFVAANLTDGDLVIICHLLDIRHNVNDLANHIFSKLRRGQLLDADDEQEEEDDDDDDFDANDVADELNEVHIDDVNNVNDESVSLAGSDERYRTAEIPSARERENRSKPNTANSTVMERNIEFAAVGNGNVPKFALNFRDIEDSIRLFSGDDTLSIEVWINDFEDMASIMQWDSLHKFIFAKRSLRGLARMFVSSERGISTWQALKQALLSEFKKTTNSAELHKQMSERKMKRSESVLEYLLIMKELATRGNIDDEAIMQYVIDGISDRSVNKSILYNARDIKEFKEKLKAYEKMKGKVNYVKNDDYSKNTNKKEQWSDAKEKYDDKDNNKNAIKCYNCGGKGHVSENCDHKSKGKRCFSCKSFGHISKDCQNNNNKAESESKPNMRKIVDEDSVMYKRVKVQDKNFVAFFDSGSKYNIMNDVSYKSLNSSVLNKVNIYLTGFGSKNKIKPIGSFKEKLFIDGEEYETEFLVVTAEILPNEIVLGETFAKNAEIIIKPDGLTVRKVKSECNNSNNNQNQNYDSTNEIDMMMKIEIDSAESNMIDIDEKSSKTSIDYVSKLIKNYKPECTKSTNVEMKIVVNDETPIYSRPRRFPFTERCIIDDQVEQWLQSGIVEHSDSQYCSPVVLVKKRDGTPRLCIDYRRLNKIAGSQLLQHY
ncbi:phosphatidylinositol 4-phosphate 5-kinase-like [Drosophila nasuta]|uniref:phosphatidylinositol 4-phosphate 5-kinase-like n=1 Tax=Drosophila nasuta TaxID=42062 RepID=UPI00295F4B73|nr:phosphatidylinositol 4-phosphate 5-kinase-like [Drosophila nasuta]